MAIFRRITCARSMPEESELSGAEDSISGHRLVDVRRNIGPASRTSPARARVCAAFRLASPPEMPVCYLSTLPSPQTYWDLFPRSIRLSTRGQRRSTTAYGWFFDRRRRPRTTVAETRKFRAPDMVVWEPVRFLRQDRRGRPHSAFE